MNPWEQGYQSGDPRDSASNIPIQPNILIPMEPAPGEDEWQLIVLMNYHEYSGQSVQAREQEHLRRRRGYTYKPGGVKRAKENTTGLSDMHKRGFTDLPNKTLEIICENLRFRALKNPQNTARR